MLIKLKLHKPLFSATILLFAMLTSQVTQAHLMVAQHGTLNMVKNNLFMVLSLPVTAFDDIDDDNDAALSPKEFSTHRKAIIDAIHQGILLTEDSEFRAIQGMMVSPSAPEHNFSTPTDQIIVTGRFELNSSDADLNFSIDLFGESTEEQTLKISATMKANNASHNFELSPEQPQQQLFNTKSPGILKVIKTGIANISLF